MASRKRFSSSAHRTLIIQKDGSTGYGLTLSGDQPVYVQTVRVGGPAHRAGVKEKDVIVKVNGTFVTSFSHADVVQLIQEGKYVALTVVSNSDSEFMATNTRVTAPLPPNTETIRQLSDEKIYTMQLMAEQERRNVERLRQEIAIAHHSPKKLGEYEAATKRLNKLDEQLNALKRNKAFEASSFIVPPPPLPARNKSMTSLKSTRSVCESPPLPPPRTNSVLPPLAPPKRLTINSSSSNSNLEISGRESPRYETPPGTPLPPYDDSHLPDLDGSTTTSESLIKWPLESESVGIINMDDDDDENENDDDEIVFENESFHRSLRNEDDNNNERPFKNFKDLFVHHAHLAVFLNYVISNSDPSSLLFYLITDSYKLGVLKDMQKWAYEIHSSFLVPGAPLRIHSIEQTHVNEIDRILSEEYEKEDLMRRLFWKVRGKCREELKSQLSDFRRTREAGLGGIFGPPDSELKLCLENRTKELSVIDELMIPLLECLTEDLENATDRSLTIASSLSTIFSKTFNLRHAAALLLIDKVPTFVSKEKKNKIFSRNKKTLSYQGHNFELKQYTQVTYCNQSQAMIWGIGPQGYHCTNCGFDVHKKYVHRVEETCVVSGPSGKRKSRGGVFSRILSDKELKKSPVFLSSPNVKDTSSSNSNSSLAINDDLWSEEFKVSGILIGPENRSEGENESEKNTGGSDVMRDQIGKKVGRAHSCKLEKDPKTRAGNRERRKHSDPNLPRQSSDVEVAESVHAIINPKSGSSSTSSLSARSSLDSPGGSCGEMVSSSTPARTESSDILLISNLWDSDFDTEPDAPDWRLSLSPEELKALSPKEKKRQDVLNELFHTEKSHVRNLKVLDRLFYKPLLENSHMSREMLDRLFPNLEDVIKVHAKYNQLMKDKSKDGFPIGDIESILCEMFEGENGVRLIDVGSEFTKNQKFSIEELKKKRVRDHKLDHFLTEQEKRPECRRLGLQSILPVEHQRLVKYPLLLEQLAKVSEEKDFTPLKTWVEQTKFILESIDKRVAEAQNFQRLKEIQNNLDTSGLEKHAENSISLEYKNIDLTKYRLIHDGPLTLKLGDTRRYKSIDLHVVLLEDCIMLLQKIDDKYHLKYHTSAVGQGDNKKFFHSPVIKFSMMLVRPVATDKRAFYLLNTTQNGPQIYELLASSSADRSQWFRHITEASNSYKAKESKRLLRGDKEEQEGFEGEASGKKDEFLGLSLKGNLPPGRSHSFHEPSSREIGGETTESSPRAPESPNGTGSAPPPPRKRLQRVEILKIAEPVPLIDPSQVIVTQGEIYMADVILSPLEKLRIKDLEIRQSLIEKTQLLADVYQIPHEDFEHIVDLVSNSQSSVKEPKELILVCCAAASTLMYLVNESLQVVSEGSLLSSLPKSSHVLLSSPTKLLTLTTSINQHLTSLLPLLQERDEERDRLRVELQRSQEQIHDLLSTLNGSRSSSILLDEEEEENEKDSASFPSQEIESFCQDEKDEEKKEEEDEINYREKEEEENNKSTTYSSSVINSETSCNVSSYSEKEKEENELKEKEKEKESQT